VQKNDGYLQILFLQYGRGIRKVVMSIVALVDAAGNEMIGVLFLKV
jgi:hypothetical protein